MDITCYYCKKKFPQSICRPFGPNASWICLPCGTSKENMAETIKQMHPHTVIDETVMERISTQALDTIAEISGTAATLPDKPRLLN